MKIEFFVFSSHSSREEFLLFFYFLFFSNKITAAKKKLFNATRKKLKNSTRFPACFTDVLKILSDNYAFNAVFMFTEPSKFCIIFHNYVDFF